MRTAATLATDQGAPRAARDLVRGMAEQAGCAPRQVEVAALLTSELVTNAVLHGGGDAIEVRYHVEPTIIEVAVCDGSPQEPIVKDVGTDEVRGRGMAIVRSLAESWGVAPEPTGKAVWFRLPCHPMAASGAG